MPSNTIIGALRVILGADTKDLDKGLAGALTNVSKFSKGIEGVGKELFNLRNAFLVAGAASVVAFAKKGADAGDEIAKTAKKIGITTDSLQELRYAAGLSGTKTEEFDAALLQLNKRIGDVNGGVTEAAVTLGKLGFSMAEIRGQKTDDLFKQIADRLRGVKDPMEQSRIATELFGKAGQQLLPVLLEGSAGLAKMGEEARKLGLVLSADTLKKAEEANDEFERIGTALKVAGVNISVGFLPALEKVRETVTSQDFQSGVRTLATDFGALVGFLVDHRKELAESAAAFAGFRLGAAFGRNFGPQAALLFGAVGAIGGLGLAARETRPELEKLRSTIEGLQPNIEALERLRDKTSDSDKIFDLTAQIDNLKQLQAGAREQIKAIETQQELLRELSRPHSADPAKITVTLPFDPNIAKAVEDLSLKIRTLRGDYDNLAPGFVGAAQSLKVFKDGIVPTSIDLATMNPQLLDLNAKMLVLQGLTLTTPQNEFVTLAAAIDGANAALERGGLSAEKYSELQKASADLSSTFWLKSGASIAGSFSSIAQSFGSENAKMVAAAKIFSAVQALISTYTAQAKALELPFPANFAAMAAVGAAGFGLVASIKSAVVPKAATGGMITGPGTATSDSIHTMLSNKEYIINAGATAKFRPLLDAINFGRIPNLGALAPPIMPAAFELRQMIDLARNGAASGESGQSVGYRALQPINITLPGENYSRESVHRLLDHVGEAIRDGYVLNVTHP